jgi:hypothetical protein
MIHALDVPKGNWVNFTNILNRYALERPVRLEVVERELLGTTFIYFQHLAALPEHVVEGTEESHPL